MTRSQRTRIAAALGVVALAAATPDFSKLGPAVGERMPDFSAPDQNGQTRTVASLLKRNGAILVFFRSADW